MLAAQKPGPDSHRTLRPVVDPDTAWSVIALVNLAKVTHTNFRRAKENSPKTVELVKSSYQPTKAEMEEDFRINATPEEIADALLAPVKGRWIDKPRQRRQRR